MKLLGAVFIMLFLCSCIFIGEPLEYPYPKVAAVLKQKFKDYENQFGYIKPNIEEQPGYLYIYQQKCIDFYHSDTIEIKLKELNPESSKIKIILQSSNKRWDFQYEEKEKSKAFLEALKVKLKTGKWPENPWDLQ